MAVRFDVKKNLNFANAGTARASIVQSKTRCWKCTKKTKTVHVFNFHPPARIATQFFKKRRRLRHAFFQKKAPIAQRIFSKKGAHCAMRYIGPVFNEVYTESARNVRRATHSMGHCIAYNIFHRSQWSSLWWFANWPSCIARNTRSYNIARNTFNATSASQQRTILTRTSQSHCRWAQYRHCEQYTDNVLLALTH